MKTNNLSYVLLGVLFFAVSCSTPKKAEEELSEESTEVVEDQGPDASNGIVVSHKVEDFDKWLEAFNAADSSLKANGFFNLTIHRSAEDSSMVVITGYSAGHDAAKTFMASENTQTGMADAGVTGDVAVSYWDMAWQRENAQDYEFTQAMMVRHDVEDVATWQAKFEEHDSTRIANGIIAIVTGVNADSDSVSNVGIYLGVQDLEKWNAFVESTDLQSAMDEAGVIGEPTINLLNIVPTSVETM